MNLRSMLWLAFLLLMLTVLLVGCAENPSPNGPIQTEGQPLLAVVLDGGLLLLDRETGQWLGDPLGLGTAPNDVVSEGNRLYVVNSSSCDLHEFRYEGDEIRYVRRLDLGLAQNRNPYAAAVTGDGRLLVSNLLANSVSVVDLEQWSLDTLWQTGSAPEGIVVHQGLAYVLNSGYDFTTLSFHPGSVFAFDLTTGERLDSLALGINAQYGTITPEGLLAVTCTGDYGSTPGEIRLLELNPLRDVETIPVAGFPGRIEVTPSGDLYSSAGGWSIDGEEQGLVVRLQPATGTPELIATALGTIDIAVAGDDAFYVVAREGARLQYFTSDTLTTSWDLPDSPVAIVNWNPSQL